VRTSGAAHSDVMTTALAPSPALVTLVADLDAVARHASPSATIDAVAAALRPHLGRPDLLAPDQRIGDAAGYRQHLLHVAPDGAWSLVALVWLPGQETAVHDHVTWCVVGVHEGYEHETRCACGPRASSAATTSRCGARGDPPGVITGSTSREPPSCSW
jgi:predicted metal-dependent enzyme (double-stranded beta helix superfamily)